MKKLLSEVTEESEIREDQLQNYIDSYIIFEARSYVEYLLNPQGKLPPRIHEFNMGLIFAPNLADLSWKLNFETWVIEKDNAESMKIFKQIRDILTEEYKPNNNLCYYPLYMIDPSNSSKLIHWLPHDIILREKREEYIESPSKLMDYIESYREKLHIDKDIEIVSAKIVGNFIHIRIRNDDFDATIPIGYPTKHRTYQDEEWNTIWLWDRNGNIFSPKWFKHVKLIIDDDELKKEVKEAHEQGARYMVNLYAWRGPEYINEENYKYFYHTVIEDWISDEEAIKNWWILRHFSNKRVIVNQVNDQDWNYLSTTQDQILPDFWKENWTEEEQEKYNYWKETFKEEIHRFIDAWVDGMRIDLAHGFKKDNECNLLKTLLVEASEYAEEKYNKNERHNKEVFFILETYDFSSYWGTNQQSFRNWNSSFSYPAIKVYHTAAEEKLKELRGDNGDKNIVGDHSYTHQNLSTIYEVMVAEATYDDYSLKQLSDWAWIDIMHLLEFKILRGKAWFNNIITGRDFAGLYWELFPQVPWWERIDDEWWFWTHCLLNDEEIKFYVENNWLKRFKKAPWLKQIKLISEYPEISGITINQKETTFIFNFIDGSKRVFNFNKLKNWWEPETIIPEESPKILSKENTKKLARLIELQNKNNQPQLDTWLPPIDDYTFWEGFVKFVISNAKETRGIDEWDREQLEDYFKLNRKELIEKYCNLCHVEEKETDNIQISEEIKQLMKELKQTAKNILEDSVRKTHPNLLDKEELLEND